MLGISSNTGIGAGTRNIASYSAREPLTISFSLSRFQVLLLEVGSQLLVCQLVQDIIVVF